MGKTISVSIQKGGTGKSTVCRNLGEGVSNTGKRVLFIDNDPQSNLTHSIFGDNLPESIMRLADTITGGGQTTQPGASNSYLLYVPDEMPEPVQITENLFIIGASKHLAEMSTKDADSIYEFKEKIEFLSTQFDYIFIDCPPAAGTLQTAAHVSSNYLIIPTNLSQDSIDGVKEQVLSMKAHKRRMNPGLEVLGILVNGKDSHKINIEEMFLESLAETYGQMVMTSVINHSVKVSEARSFNKCVMEYAPKSVQASQYNELIKEFILRIEARV